jgi:hypothetical protein
MNPKAPKAPNALPLPLPYYFALTADIRISRWWQYGSYSITIKNKDQYASFTENFDKVRDGTNPIYVTLSIPPLQGEPNDPAATLFVEPRLRKDEGGPLSFIVYNRTVRSRIYHRIPIGSFKNAFFVFSNTSPCIPPQ